MISEALIQEINRYRDWPIRILTFTSVLYFAVIAGILSGHIQFVSQVKIVLGIVFTALSGWTWYLLWLCHTRYQIVRNAQVKLENQLRLDKCEIFPPEWLKVRTVSPRTALEGWGFFFFIALGFYLAFLLVLLFDRSMFISIPPAQL